MRSFGIKMISLITICILIGAYQISAHNFASMMASAEDMKAELRNQIAQAEAERSAFVYRDGAYEGTALGYSGNIRVKVTVSGGAISAVDIVSTKDDAAYLKMASKITDEIVTKQTTEGIDTVSGATFSSRGILDAAEEALKGAAVQ